MSTTRPDIRPWLKEAVQRKDEMGRPTPHRFSGFAYMSTFLLGRVPFKMVPDEFWALTRADDDFTAAVVSCPCGATPFVEAAAYPVKCECDRRFFFDGTSVWSLCPPAGDGQRSDEEPERPS